MKGLFFAITFLLAPLMVFAQVAADPISDLDAIQQILAQLTGGKLAGLALVAAVVQVIMIALRAQTVVKMIGEAKGQLRLALVLLLSYIGGLVVLMQGGMSLGAAFMHSSSLAAFQVLAHQIYTVYMESKKK